MAELDGGPQLQLHALLHRRESQQQERLAVNVLSENKAGLEPRPCALRPYRVTAACTLGPRAGQGHEGLLAWPPILESLGRDSDLA